MNYSQPANHVELVSIAANGLTIDQLLTEKLSHKLTWLRQGASIGDAGIHPAEPLLERFKSLGLDNFFEFFDLSSIEPDTLESLFKVGGDGDGNEYVVGVKSQCFYSMYHGDEEFELVGDSVDSFIQWVIRERSDHLEGCPWEIFVPSDNTFIDSIWHVEPVDLEPLVEKARELGTWTREYYSPHGFELFDQGKEVDFQFKTEHRGKKSHLQIRAAAKTPLIESYLKWLMDRGFGRD